MCSKCYKDSVQQVQKDVTQTQSVTASHLPEPVDEANCFECQKKLGINVFRCKCSHNFCKKHRYAEDHNCNFDFKANKEIQLKDRNPMMKQKQLDQI
mmetsp:Transcript_26951/g.59249  ORF Transcript_26951/g.59249 Transcript_26951/m.59249 type:complete len:97 (+) Transcript_26951:133-423(+)